jgi:uncharacterized membrane protein
MSIWGRIKRWVIAGVGLSAAAAILTLYILLGQARAGRRKARERAADAKAHAALLEAAQREDAETLADANQAADEVADEAAKAPPPDTDSHDDFEGTR